MAHDPEAFKEKLEHWRANGLMLSPRFPGQRRYGVPRDKSNSNAWERGIARDERGVPLLMPGTVTPMPIKHYADNRRKIDGQIRRMRNSQE